ncbi:Uncharacterised protein [Mycobacteroides abscessus subsp. abscessus]|nr:Uncharacterised protein [Mycobacteroides abscessus subsp. abscessus]
MRLIGRIPASRRRWRIQYGVAFVGSMPVTWRAVNTSAPGTPSMGRTSSITTGNPSAVGAFTSATDSLPKSVKDCPFICAYSRAMPRIES